MPRPKQWRVRVKRLIEDWVEVTAYTEAGAYIEAEKMPGVASVLLKSAMLADEVDQRPPIRGEDT